MCRHSLMCKGKRVLRRVSERSVKPLQPVKEHWTGTFIHQLWKCTFSNILSALVLRTSRVSKGLTRGTFHTRGFISASLHSNQSLSYEEDNKCLYSLSLISFESLNKFLQGLLLVLTVHVKLFLQLRNWKHKSTLLPSLVNTWWTA